MPTDSPRGNSGEKKAFVLFLPWKLFLTILASTTAVLTKLDPVISDAESGTRAVNLIPQETPHGTVNVI